MVDMHDGATVCNQPPLLLNWHRSVHTGVIFLFFFPISLSVSGCVRPFMVQHGSTNLTESNRGSFPVGTVLQYSCDPGYLADGPSVLACTPLGRWSSEPPRCVRSDGE